MSDKARSHLSTSCSNAFTNRDAFIVDSFTWLSSSAWFISSVCLKCQPQHTGFDNDSHKPWQWQPRTMTMTATNHDNDSHKPWQWQPQTMTMTATNHDNDGHKLWQWRPQTMTMTATNYDNDSHKPWQWQSQTMTMTVTNHDNDDHKPWPWADPDGCTGYTCPLQTNGRQKWSDRVSFVSLAG